MSSYVFCNAKVLYIVMYGRFSYCCAGVTKMMMASVLSKIKGFYILWYSQRFFHPHVSPKVIIWGFWLILNVFAKLRDISEMFVN